MSLTDFTTHDETVSDIVTYIEELPVLLQLFLQSLDLLLQVSALCPLSLLQLDHLVDLLLQLHLQQLHLLQEVGVLLLCLTLDLHLLFHQLLRLLQQVYRTRWRKEERLALTAWRPELVELSYLVIQV